MTFSDLGDGECLMETYNSNVNDDFDVYFKRAAQLQLQPQLHHLTTPVHHDQPQQPRQQAGSAARRDSAPDRRSSSTERRRSGGGSVRHKRTSSCRYPQRRPVVTVTHDQPAPPSEHTPLTATCHQSAVNEHRQLCE